MFTQHFVDARLPAFALPAVGRQHVGVDLDCLVDFTMILILRNGFFRNFDTAGEFLVSGKWHHESDERRPARLGQRGPRQPVTQPNKVQGRCGHDMLQVGFC